MSYLSRARIDAADARGRETLRQLARGPYIEHQRLWTLWGTRPDAQRDFLFRRVEGGTPTYYLLSESPPVMETPGWQIETKLFQPQLEEGDELAFDLRANPVVTRRTEGGARRHDVVCDALRTQAGEPIDRALIERAAGLAWLAKQGSRCGFRFDEGEVRTGAYRQERVRKDGGGDIRYSTLDFSGRLTVTDPEPFRAALRNGLGKAKAFGCGLLLVRRA
ncbi:MAG: cas6e [Hydrocarboniphaga sp.]|uniref:type I-E CRISPR-associated protein Cas6/Cse3/CasE n=1 Tax=Hydrocarboniphaga sp. TaxID=2033016 RepID=UPI0026240D00|nr:type I-E CRISPR-associated protein Cas6/Cse3/CasE [Hydrocarboniphaga sp.]MDB5969448.1 cas6e [Hydrocarboniphaga sp.]